MEFSGINRSEWVVMGLSVCTGKALLIESHSDLPPVFHEKRVPRSVAPEQ